MMTKWFVELRETLTYNLEVEANNVQEAEDKAFNHPRFASDDWDDNDAVIAAIGVMPEPEPEPQKEREHGIVVTDDVDLPYKVINAHTSNVVAAFNEFDQAQDFIIMIEGE